MRAPDRFFVVASGALLLLVIAGFSQTYYLRSLVGTEHLPPAMQELPRYLHLHGVVLSLWFLLAMLQPGLIASRRPDLHRRVGWLGVALAVALVLVTLVVLLGAIARSPENGVPPEALPLVVFGDLFALVVFSALVTSAILMRRRPDTHKRLMLLASIAIVGPAVSRFPGVLQVPFLIAAVQLAFMVAMVVNDRLRTGRIQSATLLGTLLIIAGLVTGIVVGVSGVGRTIVEGLT